MSWRVPLKEIELPEGDVDAVLDTLRSEWLTMGPRTAELEHAFSERFDSPHAVAVSSGTAALHLACIAAGVGPGDEVIVPAMTFVAPAHAGRYPGGTTVLCDLLDPREPNLDPEDVAKRITARTKAVVAVHMWGYPAQVARLRELCDERQLVLIEDCCQADGAILEGDRMVGTVGDAGCFSFSAKTLLGVGEGGLLISGDPELAERVRLLRSHAMTAVTWERYTGQAETYDITDLGFNYRIDEMRATLAMRRLAHLSDAVEAMRAVVRGYRELLGDVEGVELCFDSDAVERAAHFAFPVLLPDAERRDAVRERLQERGIQTTFYPALSRLTEYRSAPGADSVPRTVEFADRHCCLPVFPYLTRERVELVVDELRDALLQ